MEKQGVKPAMIGQCRYAFDITIRFMRQQERCAPTLSGRNLSGLSKHKWLP